MNDISSIADGFQKILTEEADELGKSTHFIERSVKLSGSTFIQTLVFGFLSKPDLTCGELSQSAASVGLEISPQGLEQRFTEEAACFVQSVLEKAVEIVICGVQKVNIPLLNRFEGVYLRDSSVIMLPKALQDLWRGNGASQGANAAIKLQVSYNYSTGQVKGPTLHNGRDADGKSPFQEESLPCGALRLADLGFFDLAQFQADNEKQVYWISRLKVHTALCWEDGKRMDILPWLQSQSEIELDVPVRLGATHQIPCRLLVQRVPQEVADQRRRRMREEGRIKGQPVSEERLALAAWTLMLTNVPVEKLSLEESLILARMRWQIELLFKLWKSHAKIDEWRSENPWRILCELYAKLLGMVISQWFFSSFLWQNPQRSLFRAAMSIQKFAVAIAISLANRQHLEQVLTAIQRCLMSYCGQEKRRTHPAAFQLLTQADHANVSLR